MAITNEQIFKVADDLKAAGVNPTLAEVRKVLGSGSFSTISEAMKAWREEQEQPTTPITDPAPAVVKERLDVLGADLWAVAISLANDKLRTEREALELARVEMEESQKETAEMADQLAQEIEDLRRQNEGLELEKVQRVEQIEVEKKQHLERVDVLKTKYFDLDKENAILKSRLNEREKNEEIIRAELSNLQVYYKELSEHERVQSLELESVKVSKKAVEDQLEQIRNENEQLKNDMKNWESKCKTSELENAKIVGELQGLQVQSAQQADIIKFLATDKDKAKPIKKNDKNDRKEDV